MSKTENLNVYFYALYDVNKRRPISGLAASICKESIRDAIADNVTSPRYVTVHRVPELVGVVDGRGEVHIMRREDAEKVKDIISCETCRLYGNCGREQEDGLECCGNWKRAEV